MSNESERWAALIGELNDADAEVERTIEARNEAARRYDRAYARLHDTMRATGAKQLIYGNNRLYFEDRGPGMPPKLVIEKVLVVA